MPTYEYVCSKCDHQFDIFQPITDKPLTVCPKDRCAQKRWGKGRVKRAVSAGAGLIFKGSGFYITDYRSDSYKEAAKKESGAATPSSSGESKPAAAGEGKASTAKPETKPTTQSDSKPTKPKAKPQ
jgi:putative FmdB family regulatory protein